MPDVYQMVTDRIITELEAGTIPWRKPWCSVNKGAFNRISGRHYSLTNQLLLRHQGEYASFDQWKKLGGRIKKGEKAEMVVFWKWLEEKETQDGNETEDGEKKLHPMLRYYHVFHISQVENVEPLEREQKLFDTEPIQKAEEIFRDYVSRENIQVDSSPSNDAFYSPVSDGIHLPDIRQYEKAEEYYSTAFHEAIHSTASRLNRVGLQKVVYGSEAYGKEELIAEIGSACILNQLGVETVGSFKNSVAYVQGWLNQLKNDRKLVVLAASQAEKAVKFILDSSPGE